MHMYFTSYARADRDRALDTFVKDLKEEVRVKTGVQPDEIEAGWFFDTSSIKTGDDWANVLGDALRHAKICICLCSPTYFNSHFCGKEFQVFLERRAAHLQTFAEPAVKARVIFPILWEIPGGDLPDVVRNFQYTDDDLPENYAKDGLRTLKKLKGRRDSYLKCVMAFATKIRDSLMETDLAPGDPLPPFDDIVSAFAEAADSSFGVSVIYAGAKGGSWTPFDDGEPIETMMATWVSAMKLTCREIPLRLATLKDDVDDAQKQHNAILVIVDPSTVTDGEIPAVLERFRTSQIPNMDVLPVWYEISATSDEEIQQFQENIATAVGPGERELIGSIAALKSRIDASVARIRGRLLKSAETERIVTDAGLEQDAQEDGIDLDSQPRVRGPGGDQ